MPDVVTCILLYNGKLLLLKRSDRVSTYRGQWAGVSGYVEPGDQIEDRAYTEIEEETSLRRDQVRLTTRGDPIEFYDPMEDQHWRVHPFLFSALTDEVAVDWEHETYKWIAPERLGDYVTVPKLKETLQNMLR
jgi:8-oxo-dGTP pyrophosphatase MutT (NUDIX family)